MKLFTTVRAEKHGAIYEVVDSETRFFVDQAAIDLLTSGDYADDEDGDGYAAWCRDTEGSSQITGLGEYGIPDYNCTPEFLAACREIRAALVRVEVDGLRASRREG